MNVLSASQWSFPSSPSISSLRPFFQWNTGRHFNSPTVYFLPSRESFLSSFVSFLLLCSLPLLCSCPLRVCQMRTKNGRLFPLHYHHCNLIYGAHRVKRPIKSLFTVRQHDHQKPCWCFKCCWHKRYEVTLPLPPLPDVCEAGESNQVMHSWRLSKDAPTMADVRKESPFVLFPALSDTDCSVFTASINQAKASAQPSTGSLAQLALPSLVNP